MFFEHSFVVIFFATGRRTNLMIHRLENLHVVVHRCTSLVIFFRLIIFYSNRCKKIIIFLGYIFFICHIYYYSIEIIIFHIIIYYCILYFKSFLYLMYFNHTRLRLYYGVAAAGLSDARRHGADRRTVGQKNPRNPISGIFLFNGNSYQFLISVSMFLF